MDAIKSKNFQIIHIILGLFFTITGILTLFKANYLFSIWIISLGLLFLFDTLKNALTVRANPVFLEIIHYALALIVLLTGISTLLIEFRLL